MGTSSSAPGEAPWGALRRQRAELRESMSALELALAAPVSGGQDEPDGQAKSRTAMWTLVLRPPRERPRA